jgi:hypothetical protein
LGTIHHVGLEEIVAAVRHPYFVGFKSGRPDQSEIKPGKHPAGDDWFNWALARNGIYFIDDSNSGAKPGVKFFDFATGKTMSIANVDRSCCGLALAPDGRSILYLQHESGEEKSDIMLVKNFR